MSTSMTDEAAALAAAKAAALAAAKAAALAATEAAEAAALAATEAKKVLELAEQALLEKEKKEACIAAKKKFGYLKPWIPIQIRKSPKDGKNYFFFFFEYIQERKEDFYWCYNTNSIVRLVGNTSDSLPWTRCTKGYIKILCEFRTDENIWD